MFNKEEYWKRRKEGKRGQELVTTKFYPKCAKVAYITREGSEAEYPNAEGKTYKQGKKTWIAISRKESRKRLIDRDYTKPNFAYRTHREKVPFKGHARNLPVQQLSYAPGETNHQRMLDRANARKNSVLLGGAR